MIKKNFFEIQYNLSVLNRIIFNKYKYDYWYFGKNIGNTTLELVNFMNNNNALNSFQANSNFDKFLEFIVIHFSILKDRLIKENKLWTFHFDFFFKRICFEVCLTNNFEFIDYNTYASLLNLKFNENINNIFDINNEELKDYIIAHVS